MVPQCTYFEGFSRDNAKQHASKAKGLLYVKLKEQSVDQTSAPVNLTAQSGE